MKFRPCIDIHNGKVKQLVGGSLRDEGNQAKENFVSERSAVEFAKLYQRDRLTGGHIILLNAVDSEYFDETKRQAIEALNAYPGGMQIGGGINDENALQWIQEGATHVIVTSFVFKDGKINYKNLKKLVDTVGKEHIVLDLSCRKKGGQYYVVTDRWQKFTEETVTIELLEKLSAYCDEFLIHGVDVEGTGSGMEEELIKIIAGFATIKITYAGGIASLQNIEKFKILSQGKIDYTIGSALDLFGGELSYEEVKKM
ncbi:MAG: phosphoribosylformimino-5-aminoimidazole carboxamide ribotide isomerase [Eubacterium sp.]|nr:phosphoribosylformimino-5-aminoimidazole carboxamide ribotide isomerase [Eubacterium sp.]